MQSEGCKDECGDRCPFACHADHENDPDIEWSLDPAQVRRRERQWDLDITD